MQKLLKSIPVASDDLPAKPCQDLTHLPGPKGHWLFGNVKTLIPNPTPFLKATYQQLGPCFSMGFFRNTRAVILVGRQASELVLLDQDNNFSSRWGWEVLRPFFGRNILVRDFEDHRVHRKLMTSIFKPRALEGYLREMYPIIDGAMTGYAGPVDVYQHTKQMALDIAIEVFAGISAQADSPGWNRDLSEVLANVMAHRIRFPGTPYWRGMRARDRLMKRLGNELAHRRNNPTKGRDLFSLLANQQDNTGAMLSDEDVIDHMFGLLFAAHDTTASSLAMMFWILAEHPHWQDKARVECETLHDLTGTRNPSYEELQQLPIVDSIFKEALRMYAPIQLIPRRCVRAFEFEGQKIPANTWLLLAPQVTHFDPGLFPQPDLFNPARFNESIDLPPFAFIPFSKGSHMCLGMHFAYMEIRAVIYRLLLSKVLHPCPNNNFVLQYLPIVRPKGRMEVNFSEL